MKKLIIMLCLVTAFLSCKNDEKKETETETEVPSEVTPIEGTVSGTFMYFDDAAVFQTKSELFGVVENDKLDDLILQAETLKTAPTDEVNVTLKVRKSKKPANEEGWDARIEILEIIRVSKANPEDNTIIKLGKESESI